MTDFLSNVALGLDVALMPTNLMFCFIGVFLGTLVGVLPGIGPLAAISMLMPMTYGLGSTTALIMLAGIWYGTAYGGSTAAILLNVPGTTSSAVTCLDGHPMARAGRGGVALLMTTVASFSGGTISVILLMALAPAIASMALAFGSADYFALMVLGLVAASTMADGSIAKSLAAVVIGILFGLVGMDIYSGSERLTFGVLSLLSGVSLIALAMGLFGVTEVIFSTAAGQRLVPKTRIRLRDMNPTPDEWRRSVKPILRGAGIGSFFGTLPGTGPSIAAFIAYATEKRLSRNPESFGKGAIEGIAAPESANNAADQTAFIPTLALGIPGSATMALMLGALIMNGIPPGPRLISDHADLFWGLIMSFWIGNMILLILNAPLVGIWVRMLEIPNRYLYPAILMLIAIGTYGHGHSLTDLWVVIGFGLLGVAMRWLKIPAAPLLLGFVLGPLLEEHFRRAMLLSRGDPLVFFERPISGTVMALTLAMLLWAVISHRRRTKAIKVPAEGPA